MMKTTAASVLLALAPVLAHAECGWLLMMPPMLADGPASRPMSEWSQIAAFDTAEACERRLHGDQQAGAELRQRSGLGLDEQKILAFRVRALADPLQAAVLKAMFGP